MLTSPTADRVEIVALCVRFLVERLRGKRASERGHSKLGQTSGMLAPISIQSSFDNMRLPARKSEKIAMFLQKNLKNNFKFFLFR